jgi:membrane dipeptidase
MTLPWEAAAAPALKLAALARLVDSGYSYISLTLALDWHDRETALGVLAGERSWLGQHSDKFTLVEGVDDVLAAKKAGKLAVGFHFQGTNPIGSDLSMVESVYKLGVRHMLISYNLRNRAGDGCLELTDGGLSRFGIQLVEEMNRVGMIVDGTHTGYRTTMDMMEVSKGPVVFSHSNACALWDHPRNVRDDQIKACAATGGMIGVVGCGIFVGDNEISTEALVDHIDYIAELVGAEHVGLGIDYLFDLKSAHPANAYLWNPEDAHVDGHKRASGGSSAAPAWADIKFVEPEQVPEITQALLDRKYDEQTIRGILGENWLRLARQVWH